MRQRGRPKGGRLSLAERLDAPPVGQVTQLSERHNQLARLLAMGLSVKTVAYILQMTPQRVSQVSASPACQNLIAAYIDRGEARECALGPLELSRQIAQESLLRAVMLKADVLSEIEAQDEKLPYAAKINTIAEFCADRTGLGKHATNININADFATQLEAAIGRSEKAKLIEGQVVSAVPPVGQGRSPLRPALEGVERARAAPSDIREAPEMATPPSLGGGGAFSSSPIPMRRRF